MALSELNFRTPDGKRKIRMCEAREKIDPIMRELVDMIDDCYYGTPLDTPIPDPDTGKLQRRAKDGWQHDVSNPFFMFDREVTAERSKLKFIVLSGIIHNLTVIFQHMFNCAEADKTPEEKYNYVYDENENVIDTKVRRAKQTIKTLVIQYNTESFQPVLNKARMNNIIDWLKSKTEIDNLIKSRPDLTPIIDPDNEVDIS